MIIQNNRGEVSTGAFMLGLIILIIVGTIFFLYGYPMLLTYLGPHQPTSSVDDPGSGSVGNTGDFSNPPPAPTPSDNSGNFNNQPPTQ